MKDMITTTYLNSLDDELRNFIIYLNQIYDYKIINNNFFTKIYLSNDNIKGNQVLLELANYLYYKFYNEELVNAFSISDDYKYTKMIRVSNNLLFVKNNIYYDVLSRIAHPSTYNYSFNSDEHEKCIIFFRNFNYNQSIANQIISFVNNTENHFSIVRKKSNYLPYQDELRCLNEVKNGIINNDYTDFSIDKCGRLVNSNDMRIQYMKKKTGNIGEYLTQAFLINSFKKHIFVSKDVSDGIGFDFLVDNDTRYKEVLLDSKASTIPNNYNFFVSNNEYEIIKKNINSYNSHYYISKIFVNLNDAKASTIDILSAIDDKTFKSIYFNNTEYKLTNSDNKSKTFTLVR